MFTFEMLPMLLKGALFVPASLLFAYLGYQEVWVPMRDLHDNYTRFQQVPVKSRRDHVRFWLWGKMPEIRSSSRRLEK